MRSPAPTVTLPLFGILLLLSWIVPGLGLLYLPLRYLDTHLHEMAHAIAALFTGAAGIEIKVFADGSGVMQAFGGWQLVVSPAGYVGATIFGAIMILMSRKPETARAALYGIGGVLAFSMAFWVRGDFVGVFSGLFYAVGLLLAGRFLGDTGAVLLLQFVGLQQLLTAFQSVIHLLALNTLASRENDAAILAQATGIPALFWSLAWSGVSLAVVALTLRAVWSRPRELVQDV